LLISKVTSLLKIILGFFKGLASALGLYLAYRKGKDDERKEVLEDSLDRAQDANKRSSDMSVAPDDVLNSIVYFKPRDKK